MVSDGGCHPGQEEMEAAGKEEGSLHSTASAGTSGSFLGLKRLLCAEGNKELGQGTIT